MYRCLISYILAICPLIVSASDTLTLSQFQDIVLSHHPLIGKAELYDEIAESYLIKGRGALDKTFYTDYDGKQFKGLNYFRRWNSELTIPTRYPVDVSLGYENNTGVFTNNDNTVPSNGLLYGTINVTLLRGLLFDEQRFALRESELLADKSRIEQELIVRNILIQSMNAYVDWATAVEGVEIITAYSQRVSERHQFLIQLYQNGDKPAIDTIESRINLNTATKTKILAEEDLLRKRQKINMFLWDNSGDPMVLLDSVVPQDMLTVTEILSEESFPLSTSWELDPIIKKKQIEIEQINLENRLEKEQLKPQLDLKLNTIHSLGDNDLAYSYNINDYKLGAYIAVPIVNRKTRGQIRLNKALIDQSILDQQYYQAELRNMYTMLNGAQTLNQESLDVSIEKVQNSNLLYTAEQLKFELGESSVFLVNSRELKLLESETEYIKNLKSLCRIYTEFYFLKLGQTSN